MAGTLEVLARALSDRYRIERGLGRDGMLAGQPPLMGPTAESLAHQRLNVPAPEVTRLRPSAGAEGHLAVVEKWFTTPDPEVRRMLEAARTAVRSARGMARREAGRAAS